MKTCILLSILVSLVLGYSARAAENLSEIRAAAGGNNAFACDLYAKLAAEKGNLFFSPYSIDTALAMTYAGARGETAGQMAKVLHYDMPPDKLHDSIGAMIKQLNAGGRRNDMQFYELVVANALWAQSGYPFNKDYQDLVKRSYEAALYDVNFAQNEAARQRINGWVEKQTREKIKDLIGQGVLTPQTRLVLTNAIYFKARWADEFPKSGTKEEPFKLSGEKTVQAPMMHQQDRFGYAETDDLQALDMPYVGWGLSMTVLLPKKVDGLGELEKQITAENLARWTKAVDSSRRLVKVSFPKFKVTSQFGLADTLKSMGMTDAFAADKADFSGMATVEKMFISAVIHKAFVDVNEEGTEAAAATAVMMAGAGMPKPEEPVVFTADHPFVFLIRHRQSGAVLFMGRLAEPQK